MSVLKGCSVNEVLMKLLRKYLLTSFEQRNDLFAVKMIYYYYFLQKQLNFVDNMFVWGVLCPTQEFFTYVETLPLSVKGFKFLPLLGTPGH